MKTVVATIALVAIPRLALACPVCFGGPDSPQTQAAQTGILALLVVTVAMLVSIAGFFFVYLRRRIRLFEESEQREFLDA
jgi:predicted transporter